MRRSDSPGVNAHRAVDAGVPFFPQASVDALLLGAPWTDFIAPPGDCVDEPDAEVRAILGQCTDEMLAIKSGERSDDELTFVLSPGGRFTVDLKALGGTPVHYHVREVLHRRSWPNVTAIVTLTIPLAFS